MAHNEGFSTFTAQTEEWQHAFVKQADQEDLQHPVLVLARPTHSALPHA